MDLRAQRRLSLNRRRRLTRGARNRLRLIIVFTGLVAVNLYVFVFRHGTSLGAVMREAAARGSPLIPPVPRPDPPLVRVVTSGGAFQGPFAALPRPPAESHGGTRRTTTRVPEGGYLRDALAAAGVEPGESASALHVIAPHRPADGFGGALVTATFSADGRLQTLSVRPRGAHRLVLLRHDGRLLLVPGPEPSAASASPSEPRSRPARLRHDGHGHNPGGDAS